VKQTLPAEQKRKRAGKVTCSTKKQGGRGDKEERITTYQDDEQQIYRAGTALSALRAQGTKGAYTHFHGGRTAKGRDETKQSLEIKT